ncbi:MAG TPA: hypothetical protein EYG88_08430, partial [Desulfocapsa sulfexigens]|nr:hypothetical protein [Desulfocapsa sulfexigens]
EKKKKILTEVHEFMRLHHYSIHTERTYCDWIRKFILFHNMKGRKELLTGIPFTGMKLVSVTQWVSDRKTHKSHLPKAYLHYG